MRYVIGIDIGTTSTKAVAFTDSGEILAVSGSSYPVLSDQSGRHELDPAILSDAVLKVLKQAIQQAGAAGLSGVCFSCAMHSLIAVNEAGNALTPAMTWADLRSQSYARALKGTEKGKDIYRHTGTPIHAMSPLLKLCWLRDNAPVVFQKASRFVSIKEYVWFRFFGTWCIDHSLASATGLFDIYSRNWYTPSLELAGIRPDQLSRPVPCTYMEHLPDDGLAATLDLPAGSSGLPFVIGSSDGCLANLGSKANHAGQTTLTIGTSGAVRMTTTTPKHDPDERIFNYILNDHVYVSGGATNNAGNVLQWFAGHLMGGREIPDAEGLTHLISEAMTIPPGCEGLICLPYLHGERAPLWNAGARGVFFGLHAAHTRSHMLRSAIEGISCSLFQVGVSLEETIGPIDTIYVSGGFIRSPAWVQLIADLFGKKVLVTNSADASSIGAALLGMLALGLIGDLADSEKLIGVETTFTPDMGKHQVYQQVYRLFTTLYDRLKDLMPDG